ncbi:MAG: MBL fold metallo-hydrolase [Pseudomonadota bacterium]
MDSPPVLGESQEVAPGLRRILAPNPSPMTHWGTNTYLIGSHEVAVVDPGPDDPDHLAAILAAAGSRISHILITHAHRDHSALAPRLSQMTDAPILAFGTPEAGRSPVMADLAAAGLSGGGEGVDIGFHPDQTLGHGDTLSGTDWQAEALHTPGHFAGHLSFAVGEAILTGDHVMGWASTLISPPDGDLSAFMSSCATLSACATRLFLPGHGAPISDPAERLDWLLSHRRARGDAILETLGSGGATATELAQRIYTDVPAELMPAATRNVFAHLVAFVEENKVVAEPELSEHARFHPL